MRRRTLLVCIIGIALVTIATFGIPALRRGAMVQGATQNNNPGNAQLCSSDRFPTGTGNSSQCCQEGNRTWHKSSNGNLVYRTYGEPCREEDGVGVNCGEGSNKLCAYGPCGARVEWALEAEYAYVFRPTSKPNKCGWSAVNITDYFLCKDPDGCGRIGGTRDYPEPYTGQPLYGGVTGTCPYKRCLAGGIRAE